MSDSLGDIPEGHVLAGPRTRIKQVAPGVLTVAGMVIPPRYYERNLEHNQGLASCCRHPEQMEISAYRSKAGEQPDIYKFHCPCGKTHVRFMGGGNKVQHMPDGSVEVIERDVRIAWESR
jgi:hypothetical protein